MKQQAGKQAKEQQEAPKLISQQSVDNLPPSKIDLLSKQHKEFMDHINSAVKNYDLNLKKILTTENPKELKEMEQKQKIGEKILKNRESVLTVLFENQNFQTLYNMCFASMIFLFLHLFLQDSHNVSNHITDMLIIFKGTRYLISYWFTLFFSSYFVIILVQLIYHLKLNKIIWIPIYILYHYFFLLYACKTLVQNFHQINFAAAFFLSSEAVRMEMKIHAYLRTKLLYTMGTEEQIYFITSAQLKKGFTKADLYLPEIKMEDLYVEFRKFSYFFFAPTLLYRDKYEQRESINYFQMLLNMLNFILAIYFLYQILQTCIFEDIEKFKVKHISLQKLLFLILKCILPSSCILMLGFFLFLHSWLNIWAELLKFPDRLFYTDWWNSVEFGSYHRKWNVIVHDWLFNYIYLDTQRFSHGKISRFISQLLTFIYSAIIHEVILTVALKFFFPFLFIVFTGPGILFIQNRGAIFQNNRQKFNILFWFLLLLGSGLLISIYVRETAIREIVDDNLVWKKYGLISYFIPRQIIYQFDLLN